LNTAIDSFAPGAPEINPCFNLSGSLSSGLALSLDEFGTALMQRVANEEIDEEQAIAILLQQYRKWAATPTSTPAAASSATDLV